MLLPAAIERIRQGYDREVVTALGLPAHVMIMYPLDLGTRSPQALTW